MILNKLRGTVADRQIDSRVTQNEPVAPLQPAVPRTGASEFLSGLTGNSQNRQDYSHLSSTPAIDKIMAMLSNSAQQMREVWLGPVPTYENG